MESVAVKKQSTGNWHASQVSESAATILDQITAHEVELARDLRKATSARKRLTKAVIKANRAAWSARELARKLDREFSQS